MVKMNIDRTNTEWRDKLEKWTVTMALMGFPHEEIRGDDDYWTDDDMGLLGTLHTLTYLNGRRSGGDSALRAAEMSIEMNVTLDDIEAYFDYLDDLKHTRKVLEREREISENPIIKKLREENGLFLYPIGSTKYAPKQQHFSFNMDDGTRVDCRIARVGYRSCDIYIKWKNRLGKTQTQRLMNSKTGLDAPKEFPSVWQDNSSYKTDIRAAHIVAWRLVYNRIPRVLGIVRPKQ